MFFLYIFCLIYVTQIFDMFFILWAMAPCSWSEWTKINNHNHHNHNSWITCCLWCSFSGFWVIFSIIPYSHGFPRVITWAPFSSAQIKTNLYQTKIYLELNFAHFFFLQIKTTVVLSIRISLHHVKEAKYVLSVWSGTLCVSKVKRTLVQALRLYRPYGP